MELTVLGCAGTFPRADSACSGYLVTHDGFRLLVDAGNGVIGAMQRHIGLLDVDAVLLTHLHADHCLDLIAYSYARRYHPEGPVPTLPVHGPRGTQQRLVQVFETKPRDGLERVYDFRRPTAEGTTTIGPFEVALHPTNHPVETYAPRISAGGRSMAFSADTGISKGVVDAARDVDLFLCEATWGCDESMPKDVHLTAREAGEHAARAGAGRLLITHVTPFSDTVRTLGAAAEAYDGDLDLARPDATYSV